MSTNRIRSLVAVALLSLASAASAATIDQRVNAAYHHIEQGIRSGSINHREAERLKAEFRRVREDEAKARRAGHISPRERDRLDREIDRLERHIYKAKHN